MARPMPVAPPVTHALRPGGGARSLRLETPGALADVDTDAAMKIGAARGCDLEVLSELLPAAKRV